MADQVVTQAEINSLAQKLDELGDVLSEKERAVLLAIFKLAGNAISARVQGGAGGGQTESGGLGPRAPGGMSGGPALSAGFRGAFQSLGSTDFNLRTDLSRAAGGVGIGVVY
jgi:hypothetical protein